MKKIFFLFFFAMFVVIFAASSLCRLKKSQMNNLPKNILPSEFVGYKWILKSYGKKGEMERVLDKVRELSIKFEENNEVSGYVGPATPGWYARYKIEKEKITFQDMRYARARIAIPSEKEAKRIFRLRVAQGRRFLELLKTVESFEIKNKQLIIYCAEGNMLIFKKVKK